MYIQKFTRFFRNIYWARKCFSSSLLIHQAKYCKQKCQINYEVNKKTYILTYITNFETLKVR